jgi:hypothetical protein
MFSKKESSMGYKVIADRFETDMMRQKYGPRKGLEGPFMYASGRVLYYDVKAGEYYDPTTDFYVPQEEMDLLHAEMTRMLSR